jgi:hypothetical protein
MHFIKTFLQPLQIEEETIGSKGNIFKEVPEVQVENPMQNLQALHILSNYLMIMKAPIKDSKNFLQKRLSPINNLNLNLFSLTRTILLLPPRCLNHIPKMIYFLHPLRDPIPLLFSHMIKPQLLINCNKKILSCFNNWQNKKLWIDICIMTMSSCKQK